MREQKQQTREGRKAKERSWAESGRTGRGREGAWNLPCHSPGLAAELAPKTASADLGYTEGFQVKG